MQTDRTSVLSRLIERIKDGDANAVGELVVGAQRRLRALAAKILNMSFADLGRQGACDSLELLQELSCRLLNALQASPPNDLKHFMRMAAQHVRWHLCDVARRRPPIARDSFGDLAQDESANDTSLTTTGPGGEEPSYRALESSLRRVLHRLPAELDEVVDLMFVWGLTQQEIADHLQVSTKSVQRQWNKAVLLIFNELVKDFPALDRPRAIGSSQWA